MFLLQDRVLRVIDIVGHCTFALLLPGKFYWQFVPDIFIPFCILYSVFVYGYQPIVPIEKFSGGSLVLKMHKLCHTVYFPVVIGLVFGWRPLCQCLVHVLWDQVTHREKWQKKSLWTI